MKKIIFTLMMILCTSSFSFAQTSTENYSSNDLLAYTPPASSAIEILVEANDAVYDLCNYFNGSWADTGLTLYCVFNKTSTVCLVYYAAKATCYFSEVFKLYIEGDFNNALKRTLTTAADVYKLTKTSNGYILSPSNMCPR